MNDIKKFYSHLQFPGHYTQEQLNIHRNKFSNNYLKAIDNQLQHSGPDVLDVGCGTGLISNLFAQRYPNKNFIGVDFADSIDFAQTFSLQQKINNVKFIKLDFLEFEWHDQFDLVICQGVLHHIPNANEAIAQLKMFVRPGGRLILGLYHPWGKVLKKIININYKNHILYQDQELNPYETAYNYAQVCNLFNEFKLLSAYPSILSIVSFPAFFNYRNGGLVIYTLEKSL